MVGGHARQTCGASVDKQLCIILINSVYTNVAKLIKTCLETLYIGYLIVTIHPYSTYVHTQCWVTAEESHTTSTLAGQTELATAVAAPTQDSIASATIRWLLMPTMNWPSPSPPCTYIL